MQENQIKYALITGGSAGIGRAIAYQLAERKIPLLLVALDEPALQQTAAELRQRHQIPVQTLGIDLCREDGPAQVYDWCLQNQYSVNILVNNAGFGRGGLLHAFQLSEYYTMLSLNNRATVGLTYMFVPELEKHEQSFILLMSSMEAALPLPYKAVYAGTKNFMYGFGLALGQELAPSRISVTVLCPGPTLTNESGLKRLKANPRSKLLMKMPDDVARAGVSGMFDRKRVVVPGRLQSALFRIGKFAPVGMRMRLLERVSRNFVNDPG